MSDKGEKKRKVKQVAFEETVSLYKGKADELSKEIAQVSLEVEEVSKEADDKIKNAFKKVEETLAE